ncbi:MAG: hypothetical protein OEU92_10915 [Alphaproteobacteria bacterium]|nr:hypothetical protein [Alphaproteobacteria bacterium]
MTAWSRLFMQGLATAALALLFGLGAIPGFPMSPAMAEDKADAAEEGAASEAAADESAADEGEEEVDWEVKPYEYVDGKVDFGTYNGFRRYHSSCHVCHGPDGLGSTYAPPLIESIAHIGYDGYLEAVVNGIENVSTSEQSVMPSFGEDPNVMLYIDDIYSYLKARADGVIGRGRPDKLPKPKDE